MKVLFAGGGTGGSVTPLLAVQERYRRRHPNCQFVFIGSTNGPERELADSWSIPFYAISTGKLRRYWSWQNLIDPFRVVHGFFQAWRIIRREEPDIVVGAGSFVMVPVAWAAWFYRVPVIVHQQDIVIGLANKLITPFATTVTTAFEQTVKAFPAGKTTWTGNPIREDILTARRTVGQEIFSLDPKRKTVLIFGGGTGAHKVNQLVAESASFLVEQMNVIHLTGRGRGGVDIRNPLYHQYEFLTDTMGEAYAVADVVVCRAGLGSLSELSALGKPAIILPIPETHQEANAQFLADHQAAVVLDQRTLTVDQFEREILSLAVNEERQRTLSENIQRLTHSAATENMIREMDHLVPHKELQAYRHVHFVGIGGVGMAGAAAILHDRGFTISGSDITPSLMTQNLVDRGVPVLVCPESKGKILEGTDLLVYSSAIPPDAPIRREAYEKRIEQLPYAVLLSRLMVGTEAVGVSGTHGKTTTTAMLGEMAVDGKLDPTVIVGSRVKSFQGNARNGAGKLFIFEADEFGRAFLTYSPCYAIITTIDVDHLDTYHDIHDIIETFRQYVSRVPRNGVIVANADDEHVINALDRVRAHVVTYGLTKGDVRAENVELKSDQTTFSVKRHPFQLQVLGEHNVSNALATIAMGKELGLSYPQMAESLRHFHGTWRRFEYVGEYKGSPIITDYAHHPTEINVTLKTARQRYPDRRIVMVYQPHDPGRLEQLYYSFIDVLEQVDFLILAEVYLVPGREVDTKVSSKEMAEELKKHNRNVYYASSPATAMSLVKRYARKDDVILIVGAGNIYTSIDSLIAPA